MLLTPDTPSTTTRRTRHDSVFALVLVMTLLLATSTFFASFALAAIVAGLLLSVVLHQRVSGPADHAGISDRFGGINIAAIHVGGDTGGLIFVLGSVAILALGLPALRWFLIASVLVACMVATWRIWYASTHPRGRMASLLSGLFAIC